MDNHVIVSSSQDLAGWTMVDYLRGREGFQSNGRSLNHHNIHLHVASGSLLTLETLDKDYPEAGSFIFLSKHKSDSQIPTLTCHCTGNFADNRYGGNAKELAISYPSLQKAYLKAITAVQSSVSEYAVTIEATHHGPTSLKKPLLFVELGSSEIQWQDRNAASIICRTLLALLDKGIEPCKKVGIGLGGTHYPSKFNKLLLESEFGLAAVASKHYLEAIDEAMLAQMIKRSVEKVTHIVIDGKGLGNHKERIIEMSEKTGLELYKL